MTDRPHCAVCDDLLGDGWCYARAKARQGALSDTEHAAEHGKTERRARKMNAELPANARAMLKLKGMM